MAPDDDHYARSPSSAVDYKTVVGGLAACLVLLAGITWGLFNSSHQDEVDQHQRTNEAQWQRLRELNDTLIEFKTKHDALRHDVDDQETRLRTLEHAKDKR